MPSTRPSNKFTLRENLILAATLLGFIILVILIPFLIHNPPELKPVKTVKKTGSAIEYLENVYSRDNKYTFVVYATSSSLFAEFLQLYANGYLEKAAEKMRSLIKNEEDSRMLSSCYNNLGNIYDDMSEFKRARAYFDEALSVDKKNAYIWFNKAIVEYHDGDIQMALESFQKSLQLKNGFDKALMNIGNISYELKDFDNAYASFKKIPKNSPLYRQARYNIAMVLDTTDPEGNSKNVADILRNLLSRKDEISFLSSLHLGNIYFSKGDSYQAREYYDMANTLNKDNFIAHYNLALLEKQQKNYDKAIEHFQMAIQNRKNFNPAVRQLGELYYIKSDVKKGLMTLEEYALSTNDISMQTALADLYYESGPEQYAAAFELYFQIMEKSAGAEKKVALMNAGNIFFHYTNYPRATAYYQEALLIDPEDDNIFYNLGTVNVLMKDYNEALINFQKSLTLNPRNDKAAMALVLLYDRLSKPEQAISFCRNMIFTSQNHGLFNYLLASLLVKADQTGEAERILSGMKEDSPDMVAGVALLRGLIAYKDGDYPKAIIEYEKSLSAKKENIVALYNKGVAQYKQGLLDDAMKTFNKVFILSDSAKFMGLSNLHIGNIYYRGKKFSLALEHYERALESIPDSTAVRFNMQKARKALKTPL